MTMVNDVAPRLGAIEIRTSGVLPPGKIALLCGASVIWMGSIGDPIEDVLMDLPLCTAIMLNVADAGTFQMRANVRQ